jgi:hypothetical protein
MPDHKLLCDFLRAIMVDDATSTELTVMIKSCNARGMNQTFDLPDELAKMYSKFKRIDLKTILN